MTDEKNMQGRVDSCTSTSMAVQVPTPDGMGGGQLNTDHYGLTILAVLALVVVAAVVVVFAMHTRCKA